MIGLPTLYMIRLFHIFVDLQLQSLGSRAIIKYYIILYNYVFLFKLKPRNQAGGSTL